MASSIGARPAGARPDHRNADRAHDRGRTPAQLYGLVFGAVLLIVGLLGFISDSSFDTGTSGLNGDSLLGFEVNGWHNLVHVGSGLFLLLMCAKRATAKTAALLFGLVYGLVTIVGFVDGQDVFGLIPVNQADNFLHLAISALALLTGLI